MSSPTTNGQSIAVKTRENNLTEEEMLLTTTLAEAELCRQQLSQLNVLLFILSVDPRLFVVD